jgi:hypothetical protein
MTHFASGNSVCHTIFEDRVNLPMKRAGSVGCCSMSPGMAACLLVDPTVLLIIARCLLVVAASLLIVVAILLAVAARLLVDPLILLFVV